MILTIFGNSLVLAMINYKDDNNLTPWNQSLQVVDNVFTVIYTLESTFKIIAMGFVMHKKAYLRDTWNILDFTVVVVGLI